ncbi:MFS transporter [Alteromonas sp. ASW11-36]|uniref:MFS transporter n=1 Tax=Alteromonas arenosi TaxID=3055817 RepID=A0ABT7STS7_9ALTE|nr:MFS transporter [Alteromonas sp. ASW11-36]MDM7859593.1 MFS transporter [Alteromonas sp. ASW11-36]
MQRMSLSTIALIAVCCGYLIGPMGMAAVNVAIPALAADLNASAEKVGWLPTLYLLSNVAFMLPFGKLADNYGRKRVYAWGMGLNAFAALMCGLVSNIDTLLFWRFIQGMAGAMIFGTGVAIITSVVPQHKRGSALGIVAACVYVGLTMAPAIGGYLTEWLGWRWVFFFQVPLVVALLIFMALKLPGDWMNTDKERFDWPGTAIFVAFAICLVYGLSRIHDTTGIGIFGLAIVALMIFVRHQSRRQHPLIRVQMFRESRVFSLSLTTSFFMYGSNFAIVFLMSLYLQYVKGFGPAEAGKILMLQALMMALVAPIAGRLADRFQARILATTGCAIVAIGFACLTQIDMQTSAGYISLALILVGLGFGLFSTPNNNAIMGAVDQREVGVASASMNLSRTIGNLFGMSLINLMIQYYLGAIALSVEQSAAIMDTISVALIMSLCFVLLACMTSAVRGQQALGGSESLKT